MQLAFVLFSWFPHGGLQQDVVKIALACKAHASISIFCMQWDGPQPEGITISTVPVTGITRTGKRAAFVHYIQQHVAANFDLVLGFNRMPGLDYYFAADSCFAHKAYKERSWWYRLAPRTRQYLHWEQSVFNQHSATRILLLSPQQREQYSQWYNTPEARLIDLPPGISRDFCSGPNAASLRAATRQEFGLHENDLLVLQVGSGFRSKGVNRSLLALAALPAELLQRVHYFQIGKGDTATAQQQARTLGLQQVRFLGGRDDVPRFMQAADVLLHPSVQESAGMVLLEAIVSGLPVLTTANCGYVFHVIKAQAGMITDEPFQQKSLNDLLLQMLQQDRSAWQQAGIHYGQTENLYDLPQAVAALLAKERVN